MDFLGAAVICHVIAYYQTVLILRALKYFIMAHKPLEPGHCHVELQPGLSFTC